VVDDAERVGELLADILVEPVRADGSWLADWFGRAFDGALVEWVAGVHPDSRLEEVPGAGAQRDRVRWRGHEIVVTPLEVQPAIDERRGLVHWGEAIRSFMVCPRGAGRLSYGWYCWSIERTALGYRYETRSQ
jgi:hypothetical protein